MTRPDGRHEAEAAGLVATQCCYCRHRLADGGCPAWPGGIPDAILLNRADHRKPIGGEADPAVVFSPRGAVPAAALARLAHALDATPS